jgi:anti-sigma B factor antagonist
MTQNRGAAMTSSFSIELRPERDRVRVLPVGDVEMLTARALERRVRELAGAGFGRVVVDLSRLRFIDSTGLTSLLRLHRDARQDGWTLSLVQGPEEVRRVFELTKTIEILPFEDSTARYVRTARAGATSSGPGRTG